MAKFIVWRQEDGELDLWLPTDCESFEQAADAWLEIVQAGGRAQIMEEVPIVLSDGRRERKTRQAMTAPQKGNLRKDSMSSRVIEALRVAPDGLSRSQLATQAGLTKTAAGAAAAGLMKRGTVRSEQCPPGEDRGRPAPGHDTVAVYFLEVGDAESI